MAGQNLSSENQKKGRVILFSTYCNNEKLGFTVHLCVTESGIKAPPLLIFKGKRKTPARLKLPEEYQVIIRCSPTGWINEDMFAEWMEDCWYHLVNKKPSILILDNMRGNTTDAIKCIANRLQISLFQLPPNSTAISQPLNHHIIKQVKSSFMQQYEHWFQTVDINCKKPTFEWKNQCIEWLCKSWWNDIKTSNVKRAFRATVFPSQK